MSPFVIAPPVGRLAARRENGRPANGSSQRPPRRTHQPDGIISAPGVSQQQPPSPMRDSAGYPPTWSRLRAAPGIVPDMTKVRQVANTTAAVLSFMAAGFTLAPVASRADGGGHKVTYTVTATRELFAQITYMATEPPSMAAYADTTPKYMFTARSKMNSDAPWSYTATLANPEQWAMVSAYNHFSERSAPSDVPGVNAGFHCEIAIDGQVVVSQRGDYYVECVTRRWWPTPGEARPGRIG